MEHSSLNFVPWLLLNHKAHVRKQKGHDACTSYLTLRPCISAFDQHLAEPNVDVTPTCTTVCARVHASFVFLHLMRQSSSIAIQEMIRLSLAKK